MALAWHSTRTRRGMLKCLWARADNRLNASSPRTAVLDWRVGRQALSSKRYCLLSTRNRGGVVRTILGTRFIRTTYYGNRGWTVRRGARVSFHLHIPCLSPRSQACTAHVGTPLRCMIRFDKDTQWLLLMRGGNGAGHDQIRRLRCISRRLRTISSPTPPSRLVQRLRIPSSSQSMYQDGSYMHGLSIRGMYHLCKAQHPQTTHFRTHPFSPDTSDGNASSIADTWGTPLLALLLVEALLLWVAVAAIYDQSSGGRMKRYVAGLLVRRRVSTFF